MGAPTNASQENHQINTFTLTRLPIPSNIIEPVFPRTLIFSPIVAWTIGAFPPDPANAKMATGSLQAPALK
jgi:hypothetical protein